MSIIGVLTATKLKSELSGALELLRSEVSSLRDHLQKLPSLEESKVGYMSPEAAMKYLGMSKNTFDKYRYQTKIKIKGYKLDGKNWYKISDLDRFMLCYDANSALSA